MKNVIIIQLALCPGLQTNTETAGRQSFKLRRPVSVSRETLVISCKRSYKRTSASKDSAIPKILLQASHPISRETLVISRKRSYKRTSASKDFAIPKIPIQTTHPISRKRS